MGTYHLLGGRRIRIIYNGNTRTCGRCHQPPMSCPGDGIASRFREKEGPQVNIHEHLKRLDTLINQARDNLNQAHDEGALDVGHNVMADNVDHFPPNPPPAFPDGQPVVPNPADQSEPATQHGAATLAGQSPPPALQAADVDIPANQSEPAIPSLKDLARSKLESLPGPARAQLEPKPTGTKAKTQIIPGLNLTKSQIKRQKNRDRKRKQRAALDTSEDKSSQRILSWIKSSQNKNKTEESDESNTNDTIDAEKDSFDKKVLEQTSKSFFEDNPFQIQETYKSIFATRLSLTPLAARPPSSASQPFSTLKWNRSPSPELVSGIKSIRKN